MHGSIAGLVFGLAGLLAMVALLPTVARIVRLPTTVVLGGLGCLLGLTTQLIGFGGTSVPGLLIDFLRGFSEVPVSADLFLWVILPILLFETSVAIDGRELIEELAPILVMAILAVLVSTALGGLAVYGVGGGSLIACLLVAAIVATTDPSAVVAIFRDVGAPRRLTALVEGESLLNDAAAIALFSAILAVLVQPTRFDPSGIAITFLVQFIGGAALGVIFGRLAVSLVSRLDQGGPAEVTLSVALAYLTYVIADEYFGFSGVVAVVTSGITFGTIARSRLAPAQWHGVATIWSQLGFWASSLIFVLAATLVPDTLRAITMRDIAALAALIIGALVARATTVYLALPLLAGRRRAIDNRYKAVILWGGLRGAVTLALALSVAENQRIPAETQHLVSTLATGFVLFTLLVQGVTLRPLIRRLRLDQLSPVERLIRHRVLELTRSEVGDRISVAAIDHGIDLDTAMALSAPSGQADPIVDSEPDETIRRDHLVAALATITNRETELYVEELAEGMVTRPTGTALVRRAWSLQDALKQEGIQGYRHEARRQEGIDKMLRLATFLHRRFGIASPLSRRLGLRVEKLLVRRRIVEELIRFTRHRIKRLFGDRVSETAEHVLEARQEDLERRLDAVRLQYPEHFDAASSRYLARVAIALEEKDYERLLGERLLTPEIFRALSGELRTRRQALERMPKLDLGLDAPRLMRSLPLFAGLPDAQIIELSRLVRPELALPGERIVQRGEIGTAMYFIASGAVEVVVEPERVRLGTGEFFGELALITRKPRTSDVVALGYCQLLVLRREAFRTFLRDHPELMLEIRRVAALRLKGGIVSRETLTDQPRASLPDAELAENTFEHFVHPEVSGNPAQGSAGEPQILAHDPEIPRRTGQQPA